MRPKARVIVAGIAVQPEPSWEAIPVRAVAELRAEPQAPIVLVGGDELIDDLAPDALVRPRHDTLRVVLAPVAASHAAFAGWVLAHRPVIVPPDELRDTVRRLLSRGVGVRERLEPEDWCDVPLERGSAAWTALAQLPLLACCHDATEWATSLGWSRQTLWDICRHELRATPGAIMFRHVQAQVRQARRRGFTVAVIARGLGYSSAANLAHAFAHRRIAIPREGA